MHCKQERVRIAQRTEEKKGKGNALRRPKHLMELARRIMRVRNFCLFTSLHQHPGHVSFGQERIAIFVSSCCALEELFNEG